MNTINQVTLQSAGPLAFSPDGVLFVGDNKLGAVFAFETERGQAPASLDPFLFESIDEKIAKALGVTAKSLVMNGMAVHANSRITLDVYTQAVNSHKRAAQSKVVKMMIPNLGETKGAVHPQIVQSGSY